MDVSLKDQILNLRDSGKSYDEIKKILNCSKSTISYHCTKHDKGEKRVRVDDQLVNEINKYYESHTIEEVSTKFNISRSTVVKYVENKRIKLSEEELKIKNYVKVKNYRQKIKQIAVEYKGGKCVICGYDRCVRALEFHHEDPNEKEFHISSYKVLSWDKLQNELDKCILVCSNCHKEIHYQFDNE
jgi:DNA-binding CsgD family transcriptional regulator